MPPELARRISRVTVLKCRWTPSYIYECVYFGLLFEKGYHGKGCKLGGGGGV